MCLLFLKFVARLEKRVCFALSVYLYLSRVKTSKIRYYFIYIIFRVGPLKLFIYLFMVLNITTLPPIFHVRKGDILRIFTRLGSEFSSF